MARQQISQTAVADRLGLSQTAVSRRLRGEVEFSVTELHAVADVLGLPVERLLALSSPERTAGMSPVLPRPA